MKVRLVGIYEEAFGDDPPSFYGQTSGGPATRKEIVGRLMNRDREPYATFTVPAEMVRGAEVGDEFTLFLERAKK